MTPIIFVECGSCGHYHREDYWGDCRNDAERFRWDQLPINAAVMDLEEQEDNARHRNDDDGVTYADPRDYKNGHE